MTRRVGHRRAMTRLLEHLEQLREERRARPAPRPRTAPEAAATGGFRDCRGTWHAWDEPWDGDA